jgi:hypothetical protein
MPSRTPIAIFSILSLRLCCPKGASLSRLPSTRRTLATTTTPNNSQPKEHYDLVVIGAGPSGYAAAIRATDFGKKVLLVERDKVRFESGVFVQDALRGRLIYLH